MTNMRPTGASVISLGLARARKSCLPLGAGAATFAAGVAGRYRDAPGMVEPVNRVLACARALHAAQQIEQRFAMAFAPRIVVQLTSIAAPRQRVEAMAGAQADAAPSAALPAVFANALVQRIVERVERVSLLDGRVLTLSPRLSGHAMQHAEQSTTADASSMAPVPPIQSAPRVLRRGARVVPESAMQRQPAQASENLAPAPATKAASEASATLAAPTRVPAHFDVEALADRVVRVIDRRLTAQRERFGRL